MKKKADLHLSEMPWIAGHSSRELTDRCPDQRKVFPATPCLNGACPFSVREPQYMNCTFVAAEAGEHTLEAIGDMMGITREGVRLIARRALIKYQVGMGFDATTPVHQSNVATGGDLNSPDRQSAERDDEPDDVSAVHGRNVAQRGR